MKATSVLTSLDLPFHWGIQLWSSLMHFGQVHLGAFQPRHALEEKIYALVNEMDAAL